MESRWIAARAKPSAYWNAEERVRGVAAHSRLHKWRNGRIKPVARPRIPQRERAEIAECLLELLATRSQLCHPAASSVSRATIRKRPCNERGDRLFFSLFLSNFFFFSSKSTGCTVHPNFPRQLLCSIRFDSVDRRGETVCTRRWFRIFQCDEWSEHMACRCSRGGLNLLVCELVAVVCETRQSGRCFGIYGEVSWRGKGCWERLFHSFNPIDMEPLKRSLIRRFKLILLTWKAYAEQYLYISCN